MRQTRVGVIGGGQLAWMMAQEAKKLGISLIVQTPHPDDPAVAWTFVVRTCNYQGSGWYQVSG